MIDPDHGGERRLTLAIVGLASKSNLYMNYLSTMLAGYGIEIIQGFSLINAYVRRFWVWAEEWGKAAIQSKRSGSAPGWFLTPRER